MSLANKKLLNKSRFAKKHMARGTGQNYICQNIHNSSVKYNTTFQIYKDLL